MSKHIVVDDGHKRFSPSSLYRVIACPGSVQLIESLPLAEQKGGDSIYARRGTCTHAVGEMCLEAYRLDPETPTEPDDFLNQEIEGIIVDDEILFGANIYVSGMIDRINKYGMDWFQIENKLDLSPIANKLHPLVVPEENGGTCDFMGYSSRLKRLFVYDYKNGRAEVEVTDQNEPNKIKALNPQAMDYALCAVAHYHNRFDIQTVEIGICQPNDDNPESFRSVVISIKVVSKWYKQVLEATIVKALGDSPELVPGDKQCHYCQASHKCTANNDMLESTMMAEFSDAGALTKPDPRLMTELQIKSVLDNAIAIEHFLKSVKDFCHARAEQGDETEGWKLVRKRCHRKFVDNPKEIRYNIGRLGLKTSDYMDNPKMKSPSQLEKVMKSKGVNPDKVKKFMGDFVIAPDGGTNFVPSSHAGKPVQAAIDVEFAELIETEKQEIRK